MVVIICGGRQGEGVTRGGRLGHVGSTGCVAGRVPGRNLAHVPLRATLRMAEMTALGSSAARAGVGACRGAESVMEQEGGMEVWGYGVCSECPIVWDRRTVRRRNQYVRT